MKYQLINPINSNYSTIEQILTNRNIPYNTIEHYLHTKEEDINSPLSLGQKALKNAAALIVQTVQSNKTMVVIVDCDCDGYTSAAIFINYLHDLFPTYIENILSYFVHDGKQHGLSDCLEQVKQTPNLGLVICPDSSSNDYQEHQDLYNNHTPVIVLDHHEAPKISEYAIIINNQLSNYPNKNLSGAGVTWQFCRYLDSIMNTDYARVYRDLVALGLKCLG